jgi:2-dehydro-3-deoxygluconokinase
MVKLVTFGETMVAHNAGYAGPYREDGEYLKDCAGTESNVATDLNKLGLADVETVWVSRLGDDEAGNFILRELAGRTRVFAPKHAGQYSGLAYLNHHEDGEPIKAYRRKGSAASRLTFEEVRPHLDECDVLHVTGITPALSEICRATIFEALRYAASVGLPVSFDLNYREQLWDPHDARPVFEEMAKLSSIFKLGYDEAETVWGKGWSAEEYARYFQGLNGGLLVVTLGPDGALAFDGSTVTADGGSDIQVIDPVGAGDAFVAGFLGGIFRKMEIRKFLDTDASTRLPVLQEALQIANVCGALTCTRRGDTAAMPTMEEVKAFLAGPRIEKGGSGTRLA